MEFTSPLVEGTLIKRYKRFLSDIELNSGETVTAHCANPGAMLGLKEPGLKVWVQPVPEESKRKLRYDWQLVEADNTLVGVNTALPNRLTEEALMAKRISQVAEYGTIKREVKYGTNSRVDFLLTQEGLADCYLEVKNVHLMRDYKVQFPDSVTSRGAKHLEELAKVVSGGARAVLLYVVQRDDCDTFELAGDIDPHYAETARKVKAQGVEMYCYACKMTKDGITLYRQLKILD